MKRYPLILIVLLAWIAVFPALAMAAGTITEHLDRISINDAPSRLVLTLTCTADASNGAYPTYTVNPETLQIRGWYLYSVKTKPGATAPTASFDIAITDADGYDIAGGLLANRSDSAVEVVNLGTAAGGYPVLDASRTLAITGNSVVSAVEYITLIFVKD